MVLIKCESLGKMKTRLIKYSGSIYVSSGIESLMKREIQKIESNPLLSKSEYLQKKLLKLKEDLNYLCFRGQIYLYRKHRICKVCGKGKTIGRNDMCHTCLKKGAVKVSGINLPISYDEASSSRVDHTIKGAARALISVLSSGDRPVKDFAKGLNYSVEKLLQIIKADPAVTSIEKGLLPKELR